MLTFAFLPCVCLFFVIQKILLCIITFWVHNCSVFVWQRFKHIFKGKRCIRSNSPDLSERLLLFSIISRSPDLLKNIPIFAMFEKFFQISIVCDKKLYEITNYLRIFIICFNRDPNAKRNFPTLKTVRLGTLESFFNML